MDSKIATKKSIKLKKGIENDFAKEILKDERIPNKIGLMGCIQCGTCVASCPAAQFTSYNPRKIMADILKGEREKILSSKEIWYCYNCFTCNLRCPRNNNPGIIIQVLRHLALEEGYGWKLVYPFKDFLESFQEYGVGVTPLSFPIEQFSEELGPEWTKMRENLNETSKRLNLSTVPREIPEESRAQIKRILELTGVPERIKRIEKTVEKSKKPIEQYGKEIKE